MIESRAKKRFGQHFLVDRKSASRIVSALAPVRSEAVLEIGPGRGALTGLLADSGARVAAVEIDVDLADALEARFAPDRLAVLREDVLRLDPARVREILHVPREAPLAVIGNLPYNISKPVVQILVKHRDSISRAVLMFQKEVADRLTAVHGSRSYGPITVLAGLAFEVRRLFDLRPSAFRPRPAVVSTVTAWRSRRYEALPDALEPALRACLSASFASRRQTIRNNLRKALPGGTPAADGLLEKAGIDGTSRAEAVSPASFLDLASLWPGTGI